MVNENVLIDLVDEIKKRSTDKAEVLISKQLSGYRIEATWMKNGTLFNVSEMISLYELSNTGINVWHEKAQRILEKVRKI